MSIEELYREVILDHYRNTRHRGRLDGADATAEGVNPLCGDELVIDLNFEGDQVSAVAIEGQGCSISQASASMMSEAIMGKSRSEIEDIAHRFKAMMEIEEGETGIDPDRPGAALGDLEALQGVRKFPVRIKCADLPWTTLVEALGG